MVFLSVWYVLLKYYKIIIICWNLWWNSFCGWKCLIEVGVMFYNEERR